MKYLLSALLLWGRLAVFSQTADSTATLAIGGYLETYYGYDFGRPDDHNRPGFVYSHNRDGEVNLNIALLKATWETGKVRANIGLMAGTYANANLAAEPGVLKNVYEANVGVKISQKSQTWLDMGIFPSHIGFESAIGKDCWTLTRSILADNSPYYESGVKVTRLSHNGKWLGSLLLLNGWQHIQRANGNHTPAVGHQLTWKPNGKITLNSSSFVGSETPDSARLMRYFHNFYGQFQLSSKWALTLGLDAGMQQQEKGRSGYDTWYAPVAIVRFTPNTAVAIAARAEYYQDAAGVIIATGTPNGFQTVGYSLNLDYALPHNLVWRTEFKSWQSKDAVFWRDNKAVRGNYLLITALAIAF